MKNYLFKISEAKIIEATDKDRKEMALDAINKYKELLDAGIRKDGVELRFTADLGIDSADIREKRGYIATMNPKIIERIEGIKAEKKPPAKATITKKQTFRTEMRRLGIETDIIKKIGKKEYDSLIAHKDRPWWPNANFYKVVTVEWKKAPERKLDKKPRYPGNWRSVKLNTIDKITKVKITDEMIDVAAKKLLDKKLAWDKSQKKK